MQKRQPIHVCLSTSTIPSALLNEAPVGQTSTQAGSAQCWHITGKEDLAPVSGLVRLTFLIHWASVACLPCPCKPFSLLQALTQSSQPSSQRPRSINMPQRTSLFTALPGARAAAGDGFVIPYNITPGASATPVAAAMLLRNLRLTGSKPGDAAGWVVFMLIFLQLPRPVRHGTR